jgi:membrane associated rhomboid family serine protease
MATLNQDIKEKLSRLNILEKLIVVNVGVFLVGLLFSPLLKWLELPSVFSSYLYKPWTVLTYAFVHYSLIHMALNMLWLYFIARMFLNLFSPKMALNIYFLGAISGGLFYLLFYSFLPKSVLGAPLVGASASIRALLIFLCAYMPKQDVRIFTFNIKLWYIGVALVAIDVLGLLGTNGGGNLAHLGGVALGYLYAMQLNNGKDIGKGFEKFMDGFLNLFKVKTKSPLKTVHKNKSKVGGYAKADFDQFSNQKKIDIILDKISKSGYDSLTAEEKDFLFRAGK